MLRNASIYQRRLTRQLLSSRTAVRAPFAQLQTQGSRPFSVQTGVRGFAEQLMNAMRRLLSAPRGFGKYYRRNGDSLKRQLESEAPKEAEAAPKPPGSQTGPRGGGGGGGGGGGSGGNGGPNQGPDRTITALAVASLLGLMLLSEPTPGKEISWQEFKNQLLESGEVDRIIVTNKNIAKVILRRPVEVSRQSGAGAPVPPKAPSQVPTWKKEDQQAPGEVFSEHPQDFHEGGDEQHAAGKVGRYPRLGETPQAPAPYYFAIGSIDSFERKLEEAQREVGISSRDFIPVQYVNETNWMGEVLRFAPTLLLIGAWLYFMRGSGMGGGGGVNNVFKIGRSTAKRINKEQVNVSFKDVAGCEEAKREIMEFVQFLKDPKKFTNLGAKIPKGALLTGPPGTGKTLLAKATAGEANVPFFSISGSDFIEMFVGVGPARVRDLFKEARQNAPCIVFIDEIDAVGRQRGRGGFSGGNDERENTLNQLLVEMDGFDSTTNVVVLAGTNRSDILDSALTRPGRFDRQIIVDKPDIVGRKAIFEVHLKPLKLSGDREDIARRLAALTPGFAGADIANVCNEAAIFAARRGKDKVELADFEAATERIIGGLESHKLMSPEEKRLVAYHEAGHAVAGWNLQHADPLLKVTIIPRGSGALGFAQYLPKEVFLRTREQIMDMVCMALAGRASEQVHFGNYTTGAADDLRRVTQIVYQMVQMYGMNDTIGQLAFPKSEGSWPQERLYSEATAEMMDREARTIVEEAYQRTIQLIQEKTDQVKAIAELLITKETINHDDIVSTIGPRPFSAGKEYDEFLSDAWRHGEDKKESKEASSKEQTEEEGGVTPTLSPA